MSLISDSRVTLDEDRRLISSSSMFISECDTYLEDGYSKKYTHPHIPHQTQMTVPHSSLFNPFTSQQYFDGRCESDKKM